MKKIIQPKNKLELFGFIEKEIAENGFSCDLNHIDTSLITDMGSLFHSSPFNGDISKWDTSKVVDMYSLFDSSDFNGDISAWDTSRVTDMTNMFYASKFNQDIQKWNTLSVTSMQAMFYKSIFTGDISNWNVSSVVDFRYMFAQSSFNQNLSKWNPVKLNGTGIRCMYENCPAPRPDWYIEDKEQRDFYLRSRAEKKLLNNHIKETNQNQSSVIEIFKL